MSGTRTEEFVYKLINTNDNCGYGDIAVLCSVKPIIMQRTFESMKEEGKGIADFNFMYLFRAFTEMAINMVGLWTKVECTYFDNYMDTHINIRPLVYVTEEQKKQVEDFLGELKVNWI